MVQRVLLTAQLTLPEGADPDGWADAVFEFLGGLSDPSAIDVQYVTSSVLPSED